jgi:hypothetical protein
MAKRNDNNLRLDGWRPRFSLRPRNGGFQPPSPIKPQRGDINHNIQRRRALAYAAVTSEARFRNLFSRQTKPSANAPNNAAGTRNETRSGQTGRPSANEYIRYVIPGTVSERLATGAGQICLPASRMPMTSDCRRRRKQSDRQPRGPVAASWRSFPSCDRIAAKKKKVQQEETEETETRLYEHAVRLSSSPPLLPPVHSSCLAIALAHHCIETSSWESRGQKLTLKGGPILCTIVHMFLGNPTQTAHRRVSRLRAHPARLKRGIAFRRQSYVV